MKLYTEEQAKYFFECGRNFQMNSEITFKIAQEETTPIELPTWDDVRKAFRSGAFNGSYYGNSSGKNIEVAEEEIIEQLKQDKK